MWSGQSTSDIILGFVHCKAIRLENFATSPGPKTAKSVHGCIIEIRPHRFGGEGMLIGAQTTTLNAQSHLLI